jgi:hypothetical protein
LLFHSWLRAQGAGNVIQVAYLVPLVGGKGYGRFFLCLDVPLVITWCQTIPAWISRASLS